jgi:hypothetical protein
MNDATSERTAPQHATLRDHHTHVLERLGYSRSLAGKDDDYVRGVYDHALDQAMRRPIGTL